MSTAIQEKLRGADAVMRTGRRCCDDLSPISTPCFDSTVKRCRIHTSRTDSGCFRSRMQPRSVLNQLSCGSCGILYRSRCLSGSRVPVCSGRRDKPAFQRRPLYSKGPFQITGFKSGIEIFEFLCFKIDPAVIAVARLTLFVFSVADAAAVRAHDEQQ